MICFRSIAERVETLNLWAAIPGALAALAVFACTSTTPEQRTTIAQLTVLEACDAYAGALAVLAPQRAMGMLTVHEVQTVADLNTVVDPICTASTPPADPVDAVTQVSIAVTQAMAIFDSHQKKGL